MKEGYTLRSLNFDDAGEVMTVGSFGMLTILETLPESRQDPDLLPNFSARAMAEMYGEGRENPKHRYWVVTEPSGMVVGHAIALLRVDDAGELFGYSYSRYVLPAHRRAGIGRALLREAIAWWREQGAAYVMAHTHPTNAALLGLFKGAGFVEHERTNKRWPSVALRLELTSRREDL